MQMKFKDRYRFNDYQIRQTLIGTIKLFNN